MQTVRYDMTVTVTMGMGAATNVVSGAQTQIPGTCFLNSKDTYPLFTSMIPPLKKQNQLLPHDLVAEIQQQKLCGIYQKSYKTA